MIQIENRHNSLPGLPERSPQTKSITPSENPVAESNLIKDNNGELHAGDFALNNWKSKTLFALINCWLVYHLAASVITPATVVPASDLLMKCRRGFAGYMQLTHLDHGWSFFSPEPGSSVLLGFHLEYADGTVESIRLPDRHVNRPRLLYHRYFMLTEFSGRLRDATDEVQQMWYQGFARGIGRRHGATRVRLERITHLLPNPRRIQAGAGLEAPLSYETEQLGVFECYD